MKYQVGEKVRIKENAKDIRTGLYFISPDMDKFCGNVYEIKSRNKEYYRLVNVTNEDNYHWWWDEIWLEPVTDDYSEIENNEIMNLFL